MKSSVTSLLTRQRTLNKTPLSDIHTIPSNPLCTTVKREEWVMSYEFMGIWYQGQHVDLCRDFMDNVAYW